MFNNLKRSFLLQLPKNSNVSFCILIVSILTPVFYIIGINWCNLSLNSYQFFCGKVKPTKQSIILWTEFSDNPQETFEKGQKTRIEY